MLALILGAVLMQAAAAAAPATGQPVVMTQPDWLRRPAAEDLMRYYPASAQQKGLSGRATFECTVNAGGGLEDCHVVEENPIGEGFGEAALKMAPIFRMRPQTKDGQPVAGGKIRIPIRFETNGQLDAVSAELACYGQAAALADREPSSSEAWTAVTFFAAQVAVQAAVNKSNPGQFERDLSSSHTAASQRGKPAPGDPGLQRCLDFAMKNMKPIALPK